MTNQERKCLAEAAIPLEVLCGQIHTNRYKELTDDLQDQLLASMNIIRRLLFQEAKLSCDMHRTYSFNCIPQAQERWIGNPPDKCQLCGLPLGEIFIDGMLFGPDPMPWAFTCETCHTKHGVGLGEGFGQKYQKQGDEYIKVEG